MSRTITQLARHALAAIGIGAGSYAAGTATGTAIDCLGYERALIIVNSKLNQATGTAAITAEHSTASGSGFAAITGAVFTTITTSNDTTIYVMDVDLKDLNRYLRIVAVVATAACEFGVDVILYGGSNHRPIAQTQTAIYVG